MAASPYRRGSARAGVARGVALAGDLGELDAILSCTSARKAPPASISDSCSVSPTRTSLPRARSTRLARRVRSRVPTMPASSTISTWPRWSDAVAVAVLLGEELRDGRGVDGGLVAQHVGGLARERDTCDGDACASPRVGGGVQRERLAGARLGLDGVDEVARAAQLPDHRGLLGRIVGRAASAWSTASAELRPRRVARPSCGALQQFALGGEHADRGVARLAAATRRASGVLPGRAGRRPGRRGPMRAIGRRVRSISAIGAPWG